MLVETLSLFSIISNCWPRRQGFYNSASLVPRTLHWDLGRGGLSGQKGVSGSLVGYVLSKRPLEF